MLLLGFKWQGISDSVSSFKNKYISVPIVVRIGTQDKPISTCKELLTLIAVAMGTRGIVVFLG